MGKNKIRVAFLVNYFGPAGLETFVLNLINRLDTNKFEPYLYIIYWSRDEFVKKVRKEAKIHKFQRKSGYDWNFFIRFTRQLKRDRIDIIQSHNWGTFVEAVIGKFILPHISLVHVQQGLEYDSTRKASTFKRLVRKIMRFFLIRFYKEIVAVSSDAAQYLKKEWGAKFTRIIYNSIDTKRFSVNVHSKTGNNNRFIVCTVGRIVPVKNFMCLFKSIKLLKDKIPNIKLLHIGASLLDLPVKIKKGKLKIKEFEFVKENNLDSHFEFLGIREDVQKLLQECDIFALTSFSEGLSLSLIEAQASGLPAVVTKVGGNPEVIKDGVNGFLVPSDDEVAVADAILRLYQNPRLRNKMSANARQIAEKIFDLNLMVKKYEDLYLHCIGKYKIF